MRKLITLLVLLAIAGGAGYYVYTFGLKAPESVGSLFSSADAKTTSRVKSALALSNRVRGFDVGVETKDGVVTLSGHVSSDDVKSLAGEIARDTPGVREVRNEMSVDPGAQPSSESVRVEDLEIKTSILEAFSRSPELGGKSIDVKVQNRIVTLSGQVDTSAQRNGAEQTARAVDGVSAVTNNLAVANPEATTEPPAATPAVDPNIEFAKRLKFELYDSGAFETSTMNITADDGTITLSGTVRNRAEQLLAERIAQSTPGVKKVINELKVSAAAPARR